MGNHSAAMMPSKSPEDLPREGIHTEISPLRCASVEMTRGEQRFQEELPKVGNLRKEKSPPGFPLAGF